MVFRQAGSEASKILVHDGLTWLVDEVFDGLERLLLFFCKEIDHFSYGIIINVAEIAKFTTKRHFRTGGIR